MNREQVEPRMPDIALVPHAFMSLLAELLFHVDAAHIEATELILRVDLDQVRAVPSEAARERRAADAFFALPVEEQEALLAKQTPQVRPDLLAKRRFFSVVENGGGE